MMMYRLIWIETFKNTSDNMNIDQIIEPIKLYCHGSRTTEYLECPLEGYLGALLAEHRNIAAS